MPWGKDSQNRHNPANGLLLSATLDRAFDRGLITVDRARRTHVSRQLRESRSRENRDYFQPFEKAMLRPAARFGPIADVVELICRRLHRAVKAQVWKTNAVIRPGWPRAVLGPKLIGRLCRHTLPNWAPPQTL
jgi:HNH endonuclease